MLPTSEKPAGAGAPDLFTLALEARVSWALATIAYAGRPEAQALQERTEALIDTLAYAACYASDTDMRCPLLLADEPVLAGRFAAEARIWASVLAYVHEDREKERQREACARASEAIAREDWASLGMPEPAALASRLKAGEAITVASHFLVYEDGLLWYTSPYGVDGVVCRQPDAAAMRRFLTDMAMGREYGPIP